MSACGREADRRRNFDSLCAIPFRTLPPSVHARAQRYQSCAIKITTLYRLCGHLPEITAPVLLSRDISVAGKWSKLYVYKITTSTLCIYSSATFREINIPGEVKLHHFC
ncbi:hypothetical protein PUN28_013692 [Cardiocondyla obscurior]|uniref:Uncharacterized protein n=1 Tax=Cardiocondyla obscurior TaxID=286306 RepID=A0AAW2F8G1_9HYME